MSFCHRTSLTYLPDGQPQREFDKLEDSNDTESDPQAKGSTDVRQQVSQRVALLLFNPITPLGFGHDVDLTEATASAPFIPKLERLQSIWFLVNPSLHYFSQLLSPTAQEEKID